MFDEQPFEACQYEQAHCEMMERGSRALLTAIQGGRPVPEVARTRAIWTAKHPAVKQPKFRPRKSGLWPIWYRPPSRPRLCSDTLDAVAEDFGIRVGDLIGPSREGYLVDARAVVVMLLVSKGWSAPQIGRMLGNRDHSTILNLRDKFSIYAARNGRVGWSYDRRRMGV